MIEVSVICAEAKLASVKEKLEDMGIEITSTQEEDDTLCVKVSEEGYEALAELPGIMSVEKSDIFSLFKVD
jgi:hypothetical protein